MGTITGTFPAPHPTPSCVDVLQARSPTLKRLQVPNIVGSLPLQYSVFADADWLSGPDTLNCASASRGDTYKLSVCPLVSGTHWGSITFMSPDGSNYCWYSVEVGDHVDLQPSVRPLTPACKLDAAPVYRASMACCCDPPRQALCINVDPKLLNTRQKVSATSSAELRRCDVGCCLCACRCAQQGRRTRAASLQAAPCTRLLLSRCVQDCTRSSSADHASLQHQACDRCRLLMYVNTATGVRCCLCPLSRRSAGVADKSHRQAAAPAASVRLLLSAGSRLLCRPSWARH